MYKVLIIDDDLRIRQVTQAVLEIFAGWEALVAASGEEGLAIAEKESPDAILLDIMMPDMDGITTLQHLRANPAIQSIPVILFTAAPQFIPQHHHSSVPLPIQGVILKPFEGDDLVAQMRSLLKWSE